MYIECREYFDATTTKYPYGCSIQTEFDPELQAFMEDFEDEKEGYEEGGEDWLEYEARRPCSNWKLQRECVRFVRSWKREWKRLERELDKKQKKEVMTRSLEQFIDDADATESEEAEEERIPVKEKKDGKEKCVMCLFG